MGSALRDVSVERASVDDRSRLFDLVRAFDPDEIVHMAMIVDPAVLVPHRDTGFRVNVEGTLNVLEAMALFGVERLVNFSSIGVLPAVHVRTDRRAAIPCCCRRWDRERASTAQ